MRPAQATRILINKSCCLSKNDAFSRQSRLGWGKYVASGMQAAKYIKHCASVQTARPGDHQPHISFYY